MSLAGAGIDHPVLIDVEADHITALRWRNSGARRWLRVPVTDGVMAIADENYFDWPVLPTAPSGLRSTTARASTVLTWKPCDAYTTSVIVERRFLRSGQWSEIAQLPAGATTYKDSKSSKDAFYRIRSAGASEKSGYSNVVGGDLP